MPAVQRYARVLRAPDVARLLGAAVLARLPIGIDGLAIVLFLRGRDGLVRARRPGGRRVRPRRRLLGAGPRAAHRPQRARARHAAAGGPACAGARRPGRAGAGGRADRRARRVRPGGGGRIPPLGSVVRPLLARPAAARTRPAADRLRARRHRDRAGLRHRAAAHGGDRAGRPRRRSRCSWRAASSSIGTFVLHRLAGLAGLATGRRRPRAPLLGALRSPGMRTIVAATVPLGFAVGATEVTMTAFAEDHGARAAAGVLLAVWAVGSGLGGLTYGGRGTGPGGARATCGSPSSSRCARCRCCSRRRSRPWRRWRCSPGCAWRPYMAAAQPDRRRRRAGGRDHRGLHVADHGHRLGAAAAARRRACQPGLARVRAVVAAGLRLARLRQCRALRRGPAARGAARAARRDRGCATRSAAPARACIVDDATSGAPAERCRRRAATSAPRRTTRA